MEIIKRGTKTPPNKIVYITKCRKCGCVFTYIESDRHYGYDGTKLACPQCTYYVYPLIKRKYKGGMSK